MQETTLKIIDGPDKPALQWALAYPDRERASFRTEGDPVEAQITRMDERSDGFSFELQGVVCSGELSGQPFKASYSVQSRAGLLVVERA